MGGNAYYRGVGWYRRHLTVDSQYAGRRLWIQFDGADLVTDVYVNGQAVGEHRGGYARFRFDVTRYLTVGSDNVVAVKVSNAFNADIPPLNADYTFFGGLYRDAHLLVTNAVHVSTMDYASPGVYLQTSAVSATSATLQVTVKVQNDDAVARDVTLTARVLDASGAPVTMLSSHQAVAAGAGHDFVQTTTLASPHLWNGIADPYLYSVA